jgi:hypothetical protein
MEIEGYRWQDLERMAQNRTRWWTVVSSLCTSKETVTAAYTRWLHRGHNQKRQEQRLFLLFLDNLTVSLGLLTYHDRYNLRILSVNLLCWYVFKSCSERTILHCVESYLYYIILVNKRKIILRSETREKINRQYTFIFGYWPTYSFLVPDSCWATVKNCNSSLYALTSQRTQSKTTRTTLVSALFRQFDISCCYSFLPSLNMNQVPENYMLVNNQI